MAAKQQPLNLHPTCQSEAKSNIETVVELLLENSKHLPRFKQMIEKASRGEIGSMTLSDLEVNNKYEAVVQFTTADPSRQNVPRFNVPNNQSEGVKEGGNLMTESAEHSGASGVQDDVSLDDSSSSVASSETQRLGIEPERAGNSDTTTVEDKGKGREPKKSEELKPYLIKRHKCPECDKLFPRASSLRRHILLHMDDRPYQCTECDANYKSYSQLKRHIRGHTGEKPAKCEHCSKTFRTYNELYVHRRTHTGEKPFECKYCGKSFSTRGYRNTHERIHTGEKRFECDFCGMKFTESSARRVHRFTHTGETPYKCDVCGRGFTQAGNLNKHIKTLHSKDRPFKCQTCEKEFAVKQELTRHFSRVHSSSKPHKCKECGKAYAIFSDLTQHMNTHKNRCSNCGTKFKDKKELQRHIMEDCLIPGYISPTADPEDMETECNVDSQNADPACPGRHNAKQRQTRKYDIAIGPSSRTRSKTSKSSRRLAQPSKSSCKGASCSKQSLFEDWELEEDEYGNDVDQSCLEEVESTPNVTDKQQKCMEQEQQEEKDDCAIQNAMCDT